MSSSTPAVETAPDRPTRPKRTRPSAAYIYLTGKRRAPADAVVHTSPHGRRYYIPHERAGDPVAVTADPTPAAPAEPLPSSAPSSAPTPTPTIAPVPVAPPTPPPAQPTRGTSPQFRRMDNQRGVQVGRERWFCGACLGAFLGFAGTMPQSCGNTHCILFDKSDASVPHEHEPSAKKH